jgi:Arc/MetJ-type ribon-helix-helix transcriptional regulator
MARKKAVISADPEALADIETLVRQGKYATVSEFIREAIAENLSRVRQARLAEQVARYCAAGQADEDDDLVAAQAFPGDEDT